MIFIAFIFQPSNGYYGVRKTVLLYKMFIDLKDNVKPSSLLVRLTNLLIPFQLVGLFPFTKHEEIKKIHKYLRVLLILFFSGFGGFVIMSDSIKRVLEKCSTRSITNLIFYFACWLAATTTWFQSIITTKKRIQMLFLIDKIDIMFKNNLFQAVDYEEETRQIKNKVRLYLITILSGSICFVSTIWFFDTINGIVLTRHSLTAISRFSFLLIILFFELIVNRLNLMLNFMKQLPLNLSSSYDLSFTTNMMKLQWLTIQSKSLISKLLSLKIIYANLWKVTIILNESFGWSIVVAMIYFFINTTFQAYFLILNLTSRGQFVYNKWTGNSK